MQYGCDGNMWCGVDCIDHNGEEEDDEEEDDEDDVAVADVDEDEKVGSSIHSAPSWTAYISIYMYRKHIAMQHSV